MGRSVLLARTMALGAALFAQSCGGDSRPPPARPGATVAPTSAQAPGASAVSVVPFRTRFELPVEVAGRTRAPDDVLIEARFTAPSGAVITVGGFASHGGHRVRFAAREVGVYDYVIRADATGEGLREVAHGRVKATSGGASGFVVLDRRDSHRLEREDGAPVRVIGESRLEVVGSSAEPDVQGYLARRASAGMTAVRVIVPSALEPAPGRYDERIADALDGLFDGAERSRVDVVLVAFSRASDGAAPAPAVMFTSPSQREDGARRLRYIADRWGASPRLLAVELLDEPELDQVVPETTWRPWAEAMRDAWRSFDPYGHLLTSGPEVFPTGDDLISIHLHGAEKAPVHAAEAARVAFDAYLLGKPVVGSDFAAATDAGGLWALAFAGAGALGPRGTRLTALSGFLRSFEAARLAPSRDVRVSRGEAWAWSLVTPDALARGFWLLGAAARYGTTVSGVELALPAPPAGRYVVTWLDDLSGAAIAQSPLVSPGAGELRVAVPAFTRHVAGKLARDVPLAEH
jgi:hypothetical protein